MDLYPVQFINQPTETEKRGTRLIIVMTRHRFAATRRAKFRGRIRGRLALSAAQMAQLVLIYLLFARSLIRQRKGRPRACDTMLSLRGGRHRITYIVMGPPLVSKIGCRATTFQTTRDSYGPITSIRERRRFHTNVAVNCTSILSDVEISSDIIYLTKYLIKRLRYMNSIVRHIY